MPSGCSGLFRPQAIQAHRVGHWMWQRGRKALAVALQSRMSEVFGVDIHPAAQLGWGVMMDHATGIVIGETAVVGDNVSMLHHVTLGGSGTGTGMRHPVVGNGVLLGAGVRWGRLQQPRVVEALCTLACVPALPNCLNRLPARHVNSQLTVVALASRVLCSVLGPVVVGHCSKIGAGSVVATDLPPHVVAGEWCLLLLVATWLHC